MDLPTYTNIWRIEKRLYKLYDFRLPMPLPISWIAVFCGITVPYVVALAAIGVPFDHTLVALYVLPPGVLTWLCTRPVLENKRLHELLGSQLRYVGEPRSWARMVPLAENNEVRVYAKVWHRFPAPVEEPVLAAAAAAAETAREPELAGAGALPSGTSGGKDRGRRSWRDRNAPDLAPQTAQAGSRAWPTSGLATTSAAPTRARARGGTGAPVRARAGQERPGRYSRPPVWADPDRWNGYEPSPRTGSGPGSDQSAARPAWYDPASRPAGARGAITGEVLRGPDSAAPASAAPVSAGPGATGRAAKRTASAPGQRARSRGRAVSGGQDVAGGSGRSGRAGAQPGWAGQTGNGRGTRGSDRRELARGNQPRGRARPLPIAPPPIEVSHETHEPQGPGGVPLWGRPAGLRRPTAPPPRPAAALGPAAAAAQAMPAAPGPRSPRVLSAGPTELPPPVDPRTTAAAPPPAQPIAPSVSTPASAPEAAESVAPTRIDLPAPAAPEAVPPTRIDLPAPAPAPAVLARADAPADPKATADPEASADPGATAELTDPAELPTQTELPAPPGMDDAPAPRVTPETPTMAEIPAPAGPAEPGDAAEVTAIDGLPVPARPAEPEVSSEVTAVDGLPEPAASAAPAGPAEPRPDHQPHSDHESQQAREAQPARETEEARAAQAAREAEAARQAQAAREAEEARRAEAARQAQAAREAEEARQAEEARAAQAARDAEEARRVEEALQAAKARQAEESARTAQRPRDLPSIERALSGPGRIDSWQRKVRVVPGGQGPGQRDRESLDRDRAKLPLNSPHRIVFLGCTSGAGQTITALMTGQVLAALRETAVAAIDLNPGHASLARQARTAPVLTVAALLAGDAPASSAGGQAGQTSQASHKARLDVIAGDADPASPTLPDERDYGRLAQQVGRRYQLTLVDPGAAEVTRILGLADQLVLVAPASSDAPRSLGMTQEWLSGHGYGELSQRAVTVVNGVSRASMNDVEQAEAVARGRCRAIVRIPWDDNLAAGAADASSLRPQARHAYTALAGVLIAGLAAAPVPRKVLQ